MNTLESQIEVTQSLHDFAQAFRRQKRRPEVAAAAAEREIQFKQELEELEARREREMAPQLELVGAGGGK